MNLRSRHLPARSHHYSLAPLSREWGDLFEDYARDFFSPAMRDEEAYIMPRVKVKETDVGYHVWAELPGIKEDDLELSLRENSLIIEGEKKDEHRNEGKGYFHSEIQYGSFYRSVPFEADVDDKNIEARFQDGVLEVTLIKKRDGKNRIIKIPIRH